MAETLITDRRTPSGYYRILRKLGKGGMAEVFLARQEGMAGFRRLAVIKKLLPQFSQVSEVAEMLLDEARIVAQLSHPNVVQIYELGKEEGQYFISMEFVDGCDLATLARIERHRSSRIPLRLTLRILAEAAMGLDYAHRQTGLDGRPLNIVHRDVSPHNIMCSREGAVKMTDFGIAKAVGKALVTQVGVIKGKVQYMAPEQYTGAAVDHRSDIYSLGVILYQLTTGRLPRVNDSGEVVIRRVLEGKIPRPSEVRGDYPDDLEAIVLRALAHNSEDRYPDAAALRDDLLEFARENDLLAFPKDLGDYVNSLVPPTPLVVREQSVINPALASRGGRSVAGRSVRSVSAARGDPEDHDTARPRTEVAARPTPRPPEPSAPHSSTDLPPSSGHPGNGAAASRPAVLPDESPTPVRQPRSLPRISAEPSVPEVRLSAPERSPQRPGLELPLRQHHEKGPRLRREPTLVEDDPPQVAPTAPPTSATAPSQMRTETTTRRPRLGTWLIVGALLLAAGTSLWALGVHLPWGSRTTTTPPPSTVPAKTPPLGAGVISVLSNPSSATVSVDGARRCPSTPCQVDGLPLGRELLLTLRAPGHALWMQRLVLTANEPKLLLRADLTPLTPPDARSSPPPAEALPGKQPAGTTKTHRPKGAPAAAKGARPKSQGNMVVTAIEEDLALLAVDVRPWAEVWVNGKKVGHTPMQVQMEEGTYKIELKNPDLKFEKTYRVKAVKKKKVKISETLQMPTPAGGPPPAGGSPPAGGPPPSGGR